jgi:UDP-glucuronate decarboxylase
MEKNPIILEDMRYISHQKLPWDKFKNKSILVTGGGGFLGAFFIKTLMYIDKEYSLNLQVICVSRSMESVKNRLFNYLDMPNFEIILHDISKPIPDNFTKADFIVHAASQASPKYYGIDPVGTLMANSIGTMHLLEYAIQSKSERFIFFSSSEIYGSPVDSNKPIRESDYGYLDPVNIRSCYAESKRMGETMCVSFSKQYGIYTSIIRPFHTYGPGFLLDDGRIYADLVSDILNNKDIRLKSDGLAKRSFCYISDFTIALLTIIMFGSNSESYNVGNPEAEISIRDLAFLLSNLFPERNISVSLKNIDIEDKYIKSSVDRSLPSIEKIKELGWSPVIGIKEGFLRTIKSFL